MYTVTLSGLRFLAPVGLYTEEQQLQNEIEIDIKLSRQSEPTVLPFLNYETVYEIIANEVKIPEKLMETLLDRIVRRIKIEFPSAGIAIEIKKRHPPFAGEAGYASVAWSDFSANEQ